MNFKELATLRQSCRNYSNKPVAEEKIMEMIQTASLSPSACNSQPWRFVVVNQGTALETMSSLLQGGRINKFTDKVPAFIVICETKARLMAGATCDSQHYAQMDIGLTTAHLVLSAQDQGLATCIIGVFQEDAVKELLSIPEEAKIRLVLAVGYAEDETIRVKSRKPLEDICSINQW